MAAFNTILTKIIGTKHDREMKRLRPTMVAINALEPEMQRMSDEQLRARTAAFKEQLERRLEGIEDEAERKTAMKEAIEELLVPAFAVVREAGRRTLNMRHFDVQLIGGVVLHEGKIAEMKTGEGKTLVATLPAYLNALAGKGVHIVTVNDYLARRDAEWMGKIYRFLGLQVGVIVHDLDDAQRREAYNADVTYGTNNEFGFDYLRDNMKFELADCVQRRHHFAIVDEVDSILIDEARTPLIISGPAEESTDKYYRIDRIIPKLIRDIDYTLDEKLRTCTLTEEGVARVEKVLGLGNLYDPAHMDTIHHVYQALKAHTLFKRDVDYMVKRNEQSAQDEVVIVDEFTGRLMPGRRWSDGLHQAVEAKEGVKIERENQTLATITFQNYFRMYSKLAGMTGTADTEAAEFAKIYNLDVVVIPTNVPLIRYEYSDIVYRTEREKFTAAVAEIQEKYQQGQPVLVGTISIEKSEKLSEMLKKAGVPHHVLNAKQHEKEAYIVAQAGRKHTITVSTNMAGRGTDILLGGNPDYMTKEHFLKAGRDPETVSREEWNEVFQQGKAQTDKEHDEVVAFNGLHILATERHEARRIDNQLRGRAGRQGDPGSSRFYLSLQDDLLRIFGGERISGLMYKLGMEEGVPIESKLITRRIEAAQKAREAQNFESRKHLLEYDDVMNKQRETIYRMRRELLEGVEQKEELLNIAENIATEIIDTHCNAKVHPDKWDAQALRNEIWAQFGMDIKAERIDPGALNHDELVEALIGRLKQKYDEKEKLLTPEGMRWHERVIMLQIVDTQWKDHLLILDHLKEGIGLRGYGQKDPLVEYKRESFGLFEELLDRIDRETIRYLFLMQPVTQEDQTREIERRQRRQAQQLVFSGGETASEARQPVRRGDKIGRNDPCPCGSGKKYKKCHGAAA